jgi:succinyl-CoA synthetase beta subunit
VLDRASHRVVMMASSEGGVDIEEVAATMPEKIVKVAAHPFLGLRDHHARNLADGIGIPKAMTKDFIKIAQALYKAFVSVDASLAEINPLVITGENKLLALDGKISVDDNALFRHPEIAELRDIDEEDRSEREARRYDLTYIHLDGEIGCMVNGAGLAMATMDIVKLYGGEPANFLDIGGGAQSDKVAAALRIILGDPRVKTVLINIFGGITRCDEVARGVLEAIGTLTVRVPFVVRLVGTNEEEGRRILAEANLITATSLADAAQKAVQAARQAV